eukprot:TRINITY_DN5990_c0_g1_i2.p1 TRINITY_DN5990_c0_g1~~TRINITY_DN5990_c0_g1_i2.p1  ORF type:complete len:796 (-),score=133.02 TRINITY_DN5990_c0_g1_i2:68-2191(-)
MAKKGLPYFKKLTELKPSVHLLLDYATACRWVKDNEEAEWALRKALEIEPENIKCKSQLGYVIYNSGRQIEGLGVLEEAVALIEKLYPTNYRTWSSNDIEEFIGIYEVLCNVFSSLSNYKVRAQQLVRFAVTHFSKNVTKSLLSYIPEDEELEIASIEEIQKDESEVNREKAIAHFETGKMWTTKGDLYAASREFLLACELLPNVAAIHYGAAMTLRFIGQHENAFIHAETAWNLEQSNMMFFADYMHLLRATGRWRKFQELYPIVQNFLDHMSLDVLQHFKLSGIYWGFPMSLLHVLSEDGVKQDEPTKYQHVPNPSLVGKKLKVGYVTSNFRNHAQGTQLSSFFKEHDREKFEIFGFSLLAALTDEAKERRDYLKNQLDHFVELHEMDAETTAKIIKEHEIDIVIDLCGQADHPRLEAFAFRPAPVQISFLGYPGTTGARFMDYYIGDSISTPESMAPYFTEKLILMPHTYQITEHKSEYPVDTFTQSQREDKDKIVFCNFNQPVKIAFEVFSAWMEILEKVPNSVLWLLGAGGNANIKEEAKRQGIDPKRIIFLPSVSKIEHLKRMQNADLLLDTTIYNAHTSAGDALWAGLPILTVLGDTMAGRVCASMLTAAGFPELITSSLDEYKAKAISLGNDISKLRDLQERVRETRNTMPLFDTPQFTRDLELALRETWRKYSEGEKPEIFSVKSLEEYKGLKSHVEL